jgi:quinol-cytochrome oxidoreductase complex cytochrome b subunit
MRREHPRYRAIYGVNHRPRAILLAFAVGGCLLLLSACGAARPSGEESLTLGEAIYRFVVGGPAISEATLLRFYAWHMMGLSIPMLILIVWHGFRVRRDGGISSPERSPGDPVPEHVSRAQVVHGEVLTFFLTTAVIILISTFVEPPIGPGAEPGALVEHTQAPWIFLWVQELLRIWPPAIAGVLTPLAVVLLLTLLPYFDWQNEGVAVWFNRQGRIAQVILSAIVIAVVALTIVAALR